jgi:hypothetical protein
MYEISIVVLMPKIFYWKSPPCSHDLDSFRMRGCMSSYLSLAVQLRSTTLSAASRMDSTKCLHDSVVPRQPFWLEATYWKYLLLPIKQIFKVFCEDLPVWIWHSEDLASWYILIIKPKRCTNFSNLFLEQNFTCFGQFLCPSSGV